MEGQSGAAAPDMKHDILCARYGRDEVHDGKCVPIKAGKEHAGLWKRVKVTAFSVIGGKH